MRCLIFLFLLIPTLSHAVNLIGVLPGKWHGTKHRAQGVTLKPDKIHFRYCKPMEKGQITETNADGYQTLVHPFRLYSRGPSHLLHCLPSQYFLTVSCEGGFNRSFVRQNYR